MSEPILVVDDESALRQLIAGALAGEGYRVHQARNGAEAVSLFEKRGTDIDRLITDLQMPYLDGSGLIDTLRERRPTLKVLCISGTREAPPGVDAFIPRRAPGEGPRGPDAVRDRVKAGTDLRQRWRVAQRARRYQTFNLFVCN